MKRLLTTTAVAIAGLGFAAPAAAEGENFVLISHAPDGDSWWNVIQNAIRVAGDQMNVNVDYRNPTTGDLADMARIIEQAAAGNTDGIIVTIADYDVLEGPIRNAVDRGIPVVTINSGTIEQSQDLGAILHVGQPEYDAGYGAGQRAVEEVGAESFLCVNHYITNPASVERCQGFADALGVELGSQMIDAGIDPGEVQNNVQAYLSSNPDTDAILTLGPNSAHPTLRALDTMGLDGEIYFGTFDVSDEIVQGLRDGVINFAIDQQPFLQGHMPVVVLTNLVRYGIAPGNSINSGPGFVTADNVELVEEFAGEFR